MLNRLRIKRTTRQPGITVTELLMALSLIGVIAAFSIPKLLETRNASTTQAVMKDSIAVLEDVMQEGIIKEDLFPVNFTNYFLSRINAVDTCPTNSSTGNRCWSPAIQGNLVADVNQPGLVLPNGARIVGFDLNGLPYNELLIDANGVGGPNQIGQDQLWLVICYSVTPCSWSVPPQDPQSIVPRNTGLPAATIQANLNLYNSLYQ